MPSPTYELVNGDVHRHGPLRHAHPHTGPHEHDHHEHPHDDHDEHTHGHSHGLVDESIKRSREGVRAVTLALGILASTAAVQALVFAFTDLSEIKLSHIGETPQLRRPVHVRRESRPSETAGLGLAYVDVLPSGFISARSRRRYSARRRGWSRSCSQSCAPRAMSAGERLRATSDRNGFPRTAPDMTRGSARRVLV